jgi:GT2 family glycosyltransferase
MACLTAAATKIGNRMTGTAPRAAVIIPTHNRCKSLDRTLNALDRQACDPDTFEVIVVANACTDETATSVAARRERSRFSLRVLDRPEPGASGARNAGAERARAELLIFLDDDVEPVPDFVEAHVEAHRRFGGKGMPSCVAIGYLPAALQPRADLFAMTLRAWWEAMFDAMRGAGHRFRYTDLLSGNFSVARQLFLRVGGFDLRYRCHEDYELGYRLMKAGAEFVFIENAKGVHADNSHLEQACARKRAEGYADVQLSQQYPELRTGMLLAHPLTIKQKALWWSAFHAPRLGDAAALTLTQMLPAIERLGLRMAWLRVLYAVFGYWYARGLADALPRFAELARLLDGAWEERRQREEERLMVPFDEGVDKAESLLDEQRPMAASLVIANQPFGELAYRPGAEPLAGRHMRQNLTTCLHREYVQALIATGRLTILPPIQDATHVTSVTHRESAARETVPVTPRAYDSASLR